MRRQGHDERPAGTHRGQPSTRRAGLSNQFRYVRHSQISAIVMSGLVIQGLNVVSGPLVARMLGPSGRGALTIVMVVATVGAQLGTAALGVAITHAVAGNEGTARDLLRRGLPRWLMWCTVPAVGAAIAVYIAIRSPHDRLLLSVLTAAMTLAACAVNFAIAMLRGELAVNKVVSVPTIKTFLYVVLVSFFFVVHPLHDAAQITGLTLACLLVAVVLGWAGLRKPAGGPPLPSLKPLYAFARASYVSSIGAIDALGLDYILIGVLMPQAALGLYSVAGSVATLPAMALTGVASMLVARIAAAGERSGFQVMRRWVGAAVAIDLVIGVVLMIAVGPAIRILFGHEFIASISCAHILIATWVLLAMRRVLTAAAQAQGRGGTASKIELAAAAAMVAGIPFGVHLNGIDGAASAYFLAACGSLLALILVVRWRPSTDIEGATA